jgi:hypothetical protein
LSGATPPVTEGRAARAKRGDHCPNELARDSPAARLGPDVELGQVADPQPPHDAEGESEHLTVLLGDHRGARTHRSIDSGPRPFPGAFHPRWNR